MEVNEKLSPIVTKLFIRGRKLILLLVFILQSYFKVPKDKRQQQIVLSLKYLTK